MQADWDAVVTAYDEKWVQGEARPGLTPNGAGYTASIDTPDGVMEVNAGSPGAALAALALDISGEDRADLQARLKHEDATRRRDKAEAELETAEAVLASTPTPPARP